eukprot:4771149-Pleurochrysis_carterae.AAC.1
MSASRRKRLSEERRRCSAHGSGGAAGGWMGAVRAGGREAELGGREVRQVQAAWGGAAAGSQPPPHTPSRAWRGRRGTRLRASAGL